MPRAAEKLTVDTLKKLRKAAEADSSFREYRADGGQPGLGVRVRRGRVTFVFTYRPPDGTSRRRLTIDDFGAITLEDARRSALALRGKVAAGVDPLDEREEARRRAVTLGDAIEGYLADFEQRVESGAKRGKRAGYASALRRLHRHVVPKLGGVRLQKVTADQVRRLHRNLSDTPVEANRTLSALSAVFGWADRRELVLPGFNPTRHVERYAEEGQRRALSEEELRALGEALHEAEEQGSVNPSAILAIRLLALTGLRRAELLGHTMKNRRGDREGLRWSDVDPRTGRVTIHDSKTGRQVRVVGRAALELLQAARPENAEAEHCVCPGRRPSRPYIGIDKARRRLWDAAGLDGVDLHSLRHTFASTGAHVEGGRYVGMVAPLLGHGHQSRAITERYITSNPDALRPAADAIAATIARSLGLGSEGQVLNFPAPSPAADSRPGA